MSRFYLKDLSHVRESCAMRYKHMFIVRARDGNYSALTHVEEARQFINEVVAWCVDHFGPMKMTGWHYNNYEFGFEDSQQAFEFKMRWSGAA